MDLFRLLISVLIAFCLVFVGSANAARTNHRSSKAMTVNQNLTQPIDINAANVQTLEALKGIGPRKAQAIVDYRNKNGAFKSVDDLTAVKGIGSRFLARLKKNNPGMLVAKHIA